MLKQSRKQLQRERDRTLGRQRIELTIEKVEAEHLNYLCTELGYDKTELISTLINMSHQQFTSMGRCGYCNKQLPKGCESITGHHSQCERVKYLHKSGIKLVPEVAA